MTAPGWTPIDREAERIEPRPYHPARFLVPVLACALALLLGALVGNMIVRSRQAARPTLERAADTPPAAAPAAVRVVKGDARKVTDLDALSDRRCTAGDQDRPDPACTPGAVSDRVTQANIRSTICRAGYVRKVRPDDDTLAAASGHVLAAYGYDIATFDGTLDWVIPLTLGGANSVRNLAPVSTRAVTGKDRVEQVLAGAVCARVLSLTLAQQLIATDWATAASNVPTYVLTSDDGNPDMDTWPTPEAPK